MANIFLLAFEGEGPYLLAKKLRAMGHRIIQAPPKAPDFVDLLRQQIKPPDLFVGDCSQRASHVREAGHYIRSLRAYRETPFLLYNVAADAEAAAREKVPGARLLADADPLPVIQELAPVA